MQSRVHELLAGELPFESADFEILRACVLNDPPEPIADQDESVNRALLVGLAKQREERFGTCCELIGALRQALAAPRGDAALALPVGGRTERAASQPRGCR